MEKVERAKVLLHFSLSLVSLLTSACSGWSIIYLIVGVTQDHLDILEEVVFYLGLSDIHKEIDPSLPPLELVGVCRGRGGRGRPWAGGVINIQRRTRPPVSYPDRTYFYAALSPFRVPTFTVSLPRARSETARIPGLGDGASYSFTHFLLKCSFLSACNSRRSWLLGFR